MTKGTEVVKGEGTNTTENSFVLCSTTPTPPHPPHRVNVGILISGLTSAADNNTLLFIYLL